MEQDINKLWKDYSGKITPPELDKNDLEQIVSTRFKRETQRIKLRSYFDFAMIIFVPGFLFWTFAQSASTTALILAGILLGLSVFWYMFYQIKYHKLTRSLDLSNNTIKSLYEKLAELREFVKKYTYFYHLPVYIALVASIGIMLWDKIKTAEPAEKLEKIILFILIAAGAYLWNSFKRKRFTDLTLDAMMSELKSLEEEK